MRKHKIHWLKVLGLWCPLIWAANAIAHHSVMLGCIFSRSWFCFNFSPQGHCVWFLLASIATSSLKHTALSENACEDWCFHCSVWMIGLRDGKTEDVILDRDRETSDELIVVIFYCPDNSEYPHICDFKRLSGSITYDIACFWIATKGSLNLSSHFKSYSLSLWL